MDGNDDRRRFLKYAASTPGLLLATSAFIGRNASAAKMPDGDLALVTPGEDLMQEHGILERVLLVYTEAERRIEQSIAFDPADLEKAGALVRNFVEDYHERTEEEFVFPLLEKANTEAALVSVLREQHRRGRAITETIRKVSSVAGARDKLRDALKAFSRMYRPHAAREDTVIFPAFRKLLGRKGYTELGEQFEEREHKLLGKNGFGDAVKEITRIEQAFDIHDLDKFTPRGSSL